MKQLPCSVASSASGILVGWVSELGPAWLHIESSSSLETRASYLSEDTAGLVAVCWDRAERMVVFTQSDGTFVRRGDEKSERVGPRSHVLAASGGWLVLGTREGVLAGRRELRLVSKRTDLRHVEIVPTRDGAIVACAGEQDLGVIYVPTSGPPDEVTHRLEEGVTDLDMAGRAGRVGVVVGTATRVLGAELNARGQMRERLHAVLRAPAQFPRIAWTASDFVFATSESKGVSVRRLEGEHLMVLGDARGDYDLAFRQGRVLAAQIQTQGEQDVLVLCSCDRRGGSYETHSIPCHPEGAELRRRMFAARRIFEQLGSALAATGYRERGSGQVNARELNARVLVGDLVLQLEARLDDDGVELAIDLGPAEPAPPPRSFARLARFFRRLTPEARAARDTMKARVADVVGADVEVVEAERSADLTSMTLRAHRTPTAVELVRWLKALGEL